MRENIIQKRKISAAICEEWLERDKVLSVGRRMPFVSTLGCIRTSRRNYIKFTMR
mgnify:CR=1 FL=1